MGKQIIRLTESDLHNLVKESVNKILTELDWKTYASAADKAEKRWHQAADDRNKDPKGMKKYGNQMRSFNKASADAFNRDYGTSHYKYTTDGIDDANHAWDRVVTLGSNPHQKASSLSDNAWNRSYFDYDPVNDESNGRWFEHGDSHKGHSHYSKYPVRPNDYNGFNDMEGDDILNAVGNQIDGPRGTKHLDAAKKGNQELKDYFKGKYNYQKGKGWTK